MRVPNGQGEMTIKGTVLCSRAASSTRWYQACEYGDLRCPGKNHIWCDTLSSRGLHPEEGCKSGDHTPMIYVVEGPCGIGHTLEELANEYYPTEGLNTAQAQTFQDRYGSQLRYFISGREELIVKLHNLVERMSLYMALTGRLYTSNGDRWIEITAFETISERSSEVLCFPSSMLQPDKPLQAAGSATDLQVTDTLFIKCILLPAGSFLRGAAFYERRYQDEYPHPVSLSHAFYMAEIPVTQELFEAVMHMNPSTNIGLQFPVENACYRDMLLFCSILSDRNKRKVRLPTDAEWEYAARVGTSNPCFTTKYTEQISSDNHDDPKPVKTAAPNAWGLYDMLSYGWEMTSDYKDDNPRTPMIDPAGPSAETKSIQFDAVCGLMHRTKGGFYHQIIRPAMHGAATEYGTIWEDGRLTFRVVCEE